METLSSQEEPVLISEFDVLKMHSRLHALYDFDMQRHKEIDPQREAQGGDKKFVSQLPLEIRTQFSGFNEVEMTDEEREWMNAL